MTLLTERYATQIAGVLSCYDRIIITGTLPGVCFAEGMATYLRLHHIRLFDHPPFAPWHDKVTGKTTLRYKDGKCLHYYFYFLDTEFGLCYLRVPTWAPFR